MFQDGGDVYKNQDSYINPSDPKEELFAYALQEEYRGGRCARELLQRRIAGRLFCSVVFYP